MVCSHIKKEFAYIYKKSTANTCGKFPRQILAAISHGKFLQQIVTANSQICSTEDGVEQSSVWESFTREDKKKTSNKAKDIKINLIN